MQIEVKLQLSFAHKSPSGENPFSLDLPSGARVEQALNQLGILDSEPKVVVVNGRAAKPDQKLMPGDVLTVFPPIEGG